MEEKESTTHDQKKINTKCFYENNGSCRDQDQCNYLHPKKVCQSFSKLGSCSQESICEHRHPVQICFRLQNTGYCSAGDRCRNRHPLEYAYQEYSQSKRRVQTIYNFTNKHFLGSSPQSLQGLGGLGVGNVTPREAWTPPTQVGGQAGQPLHPQQEGPHQQQHFQPGRRNQMW